jgi:hypothetical protein
MTRSRARIAAALFLAAAVAAWAGTAYRVKCETPECRKPSLTSQPYLVYD